MSRKCSISNRHSEIVDLYSAGFGCPYIVNKLELPVTARALQMYLKKHGLIRTAIEALELSEDRRVGLTA